MDGKNNRIAVVFTSLDWHLSSVKACKTQRKQNYSLAVRQYERAEVALKNEFGAEPSIELFKSLQRAKMAM